MSPVPGEQQPEMGVMKRRHHARCLPLVICVVVAMLLLLSCGTYILYIHSSLRNVQHEAMLPDADDVTGQPAATDPAVGDATGQQSQKKAVDILLMGSDRVQVGDVERSDVIMLVHVSGDRKKVYLVHFPRDMYVNIRGVGMARINAAYANGGAPLLVETLQDLLGIHIDHAAAIASDGFIAMTDAVGGVDVYAEEASTEFQVNIHVGWNHLDGASASVFVRERHELSRGDISRGRRQQAFIKALMLKALNRETLLNPTRFARFVHAVTSNLTVDAGLTVDEIYAEALKLRSVRSSDVVFITAPISRYTFTSEGASVAIVDEAQMALLGDALRSDSMATYPAGKQAP